MNNCIRLQRAVLNISQAELAKRIQVSRNTINSIEIGKTNPSITIAMKLAKVFKISVHGIFWL
jgi:putative transcriptional regulator